MSVPDQYRKKTLWTGARFGSQHSNSILILIHNWSDCSVYLVLHFKLVIKVNHEITCTVEVTFKKKDHLINSLSRFLKGARRGPSPYLPSAVSMNFGTRDLAIKSSYF